MKISDIEFLKESKSITFTLGNRSWDIEKGLEIVQRDSIQPEEFSVVDLSSLLGFVKINNDHAMSTDLDEPVLLGAVVMDGEEGLILLDGNHRVYKAKQEGIKALKGYVLEKDQTNEVEIIARYSK